MINEIQDVYKTLEVLFNSNLDSFCISGGLACHLICENRRLFSDIDLAVMNEECVIDLMESVQQHCSIQGYVPFNWKKIKRGLCREASFEVILPSNRIIPVHITRTAIYFNERTDESFDIQNYELSLEEISGVTNQPCDKKYLQHCLEKNINNIKVRIMSLEDQIFQKLTIKRDEQPHKRKQDVLDLLAIANYIQKNSITLDIAYLFDRFSSNEQYFYSINGLLSDLFKIIDKGELNHDHKY